MTDVNHDRDARIGEFLATLVGCMLFLNAPNLMVWDYSGEALGLLLVHFGFHLLFVIYLYAINTYNRCNHGCPPVFNAHVFHLCAGAGIFTTTLIMISHLAGLLFTQGRIFPFKPCIETFLAGFFRTALVIVICFIARYLRAKPPRVVTADTPVDTPAETKAEPDVAADKVDTSAAVDGEDGLDKLKEE